MRWNLPGTALEVSPEEMSLVEERFRAMFMAGGIALSQVSVITGLEPYTIQNWVKRGFLTSPQQKRYSLRQLCRILNINMLKDALAMEQICGLMSYINGHMNDESDDIIDDAELYFMFLRLAIHHRDLQDPVQRDRLLQQSLADYQEPFPGAGERVQRVLRIMLTAWAAAQLRQVAEKMVKELKENNQ
ncbi:MAG: DUF1836 domain-containing protein [Oscillospiraceae bacterium]|nr:DUF1836 domain-containing protein [Oscillospiraceae bacterium]